MVLKKTIVICLLRDNTRPMKSHTNASGGGSSRGAAEKALLQVPHWPLGGSVSQASSLIPSVRGWSSILHRESMNWDRESYQEKSKVLNNTQKFSNNNNAILMPGIFT